MGFKSIDQCSWSSEVEQDQKMSISFVWLERGNEWGLSLPTSPADHEMLNRIIKWVFHFFGWRGVMDGVWVHWPVWPTSEVEHNPKSSISFYWLERAGRWGLSPLTSPADHQKLNIIKKWAFYIFGWRGVVDEVQIHWPVWPTSDVECNTKMSISLFWLERGGGWGLSPFTSLADHPKWT